MLRLALAAVAALATVSAHAASFAGNWRVDRATLQFSAKPYTVTIRDGEYFCDCASPPERVKADGQFHPRTGSARSDAMMAQILSPTRIKIASRLRGALIYEGEMTLGEDGRTTAIVSRDYSAPGGKPLEFRSTALRVAPAPAGAHALSGQWRDTAEGAEYPDAVARMTIEQAGRRYTFRWGDGVTWTGVLGGASAPLVGDKFGARAMLVRTRGGGLEMVATTGGKIDSRTRFTLTPDGARLRGASTNAGTGRTDRWEMTRNAPPS